MIQAIAGVALKEFFAQLFTSLFGWLQKQEDDATQRALGASRQAEATATAGAAVEQRVRDAGQLSDDDVLAELNAGTA